MIYFDDAKGHRWVVQLTIRTARRLKELTGFCVMDYRLSEDSRKVLAGNPALAAYLLCLLCEEECQRLRVSDYQFCKQRLRGIPLEGPHLLVHNAIMSFFRLPGPTREASEESSKIPTADELWQNVGRYLGVLGGEFLDQSYGDLILAMEGRNRHEWMGRAHILSFIAAAGGAKIAPEKLDPTGALAEAGGGGNELALDADNLWMYAAFIGA